MNRSKFHSWLEAYGRAWETRDPDAAARLFTEDGTYQEGPFTKPMRGRQAITEYWRHVARTQEQIHFKFEILAVNRNLGIAHWQSSFLRVPPGIRLKLDGVMVITLDAKGRAKEFREWWVRQEVKAR